MSLKKLCIKATLLSGLVVLLLAGSTLLNFVSNSMSKTQAKYQYKVLEDWRCGGMSGTFSPESCTAFLNQVGAEGWKLIGGNADYSAMYFIKE